MSDDKKNPVSALLDSLKGLFAKQPAKPTTAETPPAEAESGAVRKASSTYSKLQSMQGGAAKPVEIPAFVRPAQQDQMFSASKGGAEATKAQRRPSSTFTKLQALSASGTGAAGNITPGDSSASLDKLLDRLDTD